MHSDLKPFWPVSTANPFLASVSLGYLHLLCLASGVAGVIILAVRSRLAGMSNLPIKLTIPPQGNRSTIEGPTRRRALSLSASRWPDLRAIQMEATFQTLCPRCGQDWLRKVRIVRFGIEAILCPECDALWTVGEPLIESFRDYGTFMRGLGISQPELVGEVEFLGYFLRDTACETGQPAVAEKSDRIEAPDRRRPHR